MATKAQCQQATAELLRLVPVGQAVQSNYDSVLDSAYDEVYDQLEDLGLATWADTDSMPDRVTRHFVELMAFNKMALVGTSLPLRESILMRVGDDGKKAIDAIRSKITPSYESLDEPTDY